VKLPENHGAAISGVNRVLFLPDLHSTWFRQMPKAMQVGQRLVVIREDACGEDSAWTYLDD
jgi:hypothetical protein